MKTRFAASSAPPRVGRARLALLAWLAARRAGGSFLLRLGDAAPPPELAWLGVVPDQTVSLAERAADHAAAVARLRDAGRLYPCFETEDELRWNREQRRRHRKPPVYDRAMLKLTAAQRARAEAGGKRPYWRFLLSDTQIGWRDLVAGPRCAKLTAISDPVVVAADGTVSAALAAAIDDAGDGIGLLVREATQIEATAVHLDVLAALGGRPDRLALAHVPDWPAALATIPLRRLRQDGVEPAALATWLAAPDADAPRSGADLIATFAWPAAGAAAPDLGRLRALNRLVLAGLPYAAVADRLPAGADEAFWRSVRGGFDLLGEAAQWWDVLGDGFVPPVLDSGALRRALASLPDPPWDDATWAAWAGAFGEDSAALRVALTGEESGPDMALLLPLIGRERAERRLRLAA